MKASNLFFWARLTGANGNIADANVLGKKAIKELVAFVPMRRSLLRTRIFRNFA